MVDFLTRIPDLMFFAYKDTTQADYIKYRLSGTQQLEDDIQTLGIGMQLEFAVGATLDLYGKLVGQVRVPINTPKHWGFSDIDANSANFFDLEKPFIDFIEGSVAGNVSPTLFGYKDIAGNIDDIEPPTPKSGYEEDAPYKDIDSETKREILISDEAFKQVIIQKAIANTIDPTPISIIDYFELSYKVKCVYQKVVGEPAFNVYLLGISEGILLDFLKQNKEQIPTPLGVRVDEVFITDTNAYFGFVDIDSNASGFFSEASHLFKN